VASVNHVTSSIAAGYVASCGAVLVVAGASKLYRGVDGGTAMRRVLRMPQHWWKRAELAVGAAEISMGALVWSVTSPVLGGAGLASFGAVFCLLPRYVRVKRIPGECGCIRWRPVPETATWRALIRGGLLFTAGIVDVMVPAYTAGAPDRTWFGGGMLAEGTVLLLSMRVRVRIPMRHPAAGLPSMRRCETDGRPGPRGPPGPAAYGICRVMGGRRHEV